MDWFWLTTISILLGSIANILQRVLMKHDNSNPYSYAIVFHLVLGIFNLIYGVFYGADFSLKTEYGEYLILSSFLWGGCTVLLFKALQLLESSEVTILSTLRVPIAIVASIILFNETFGFQKIIGTGIILIATLLVTNQAHGFKINKGILYVFGAALLSGLGIVTDSFSVKHFDVLFYNTITNFLIVPILLVIRPRSLEDWKPFFTLGFLKKMIPLSIFSTAAAITYLYSLEFEGYTSQIAAIRQSQLIVTVILAVIILKEKTHLIHKLAAAVLVTIAVFLLR
jgi:drug/metabolite transporter (DMT)-like permease